MLNEYKQSHNLDVFDHQDPTIMYLQETYRLLRAFNLIKKIGAVKSKEGSA